MKGSSQNTTEEEELSQGANNLPLWRYGITWSWHSSVSEHFNRSRAFWTTRTPRKIIVNVGFGGWVREICLVSARIPCPSHSYNGSLNLGHVHCRKPWDHRSIFERRSGFRDLEHVLYRKNYCNHRSVSVIEEGGEDGSEIDELRRVNGSDINVPSCVLQGNNNTW